MKQMKQILCGLALCLTTFTSCIKDEPLNAECDIVSVQSEWLEAHNCLGIVKDKVTVDFDRGHAEAANRVVEEMRALGVPVERKRDIHAQTLNKFVREQMAEHPDTFPQQLFNVAQVTEVKIS